MFFLYKIFFSFNKNKYIYFYFNFECPAPIDNFKLLLKGKSHKKLDGVALWIANSPPLKPHQWAKSTYSAKSA